MSDYCQKCGEKIRTKIKMKCDAEQTLCGLCMDDELNAKNTTDHTMKTNYEHFSFRLEQFPEHPDIWICWSTDRDNECGVVEFSSDRNQWVLNPDSLAVFTCLQLREIADFLEELNSLPKGA